MSKKSSRVEKRAFDGENNVEMVRNIIKTEFKNPELHLLKDEYLRCFGSLPGAEQSFFVAQLFYILAKNEFSSVTLVFDLVEKYYPEIDEAMVVETINVLRDSHWILYRAGTDKFEWLFRSIR